MPQRGFRRIVVAVADNRESRLAMAVGCRLARERGAVVTAVAAVEVPTELPLDCHMETEDAHARALLEGARATADTYAVKTVLRLVRVREAATAIVEEIERQRAELAIVGAHLRPKRRRTKLGQTVELILRHAPCRVMIITAGGGAPTIGSDLARQSRMGGTA